MLVDSRQCIQEFIHIPIKLFNTFIDSTQNAHSVTYPQLNFTMSP